MAAIERRRAPDGSLYTKAEFRSWFGESSWRQYWDNAAFNDSHDEALAKFKESNLFDEKDIAKINQPGVDLAGLWMFHEEDTSMFDYKECARLAKPGANLTSLFKVYKDWNLMDWKDVRMFAEELVGVDFDVLYTGVYKKWSLFDWKDMHKVWRSGCNADGVLELYSLVQSKPINWTWREFGRATDTGLDLRGISKLANKYDWSEYDVLGALEASAKLPANKRLEVSHMLGMLDNDVCSTVRDVTDVIKHRRSVRNNTM